MTHQELDHLFASARTAPAQTSVEEVTAWVGAAAIATTGVIGIAAKLKLFIAKKSLLMLGSVLGTVGVVTLGTIMLVSSPNSGTPESNSIVGTTVSEENFEKEVEANILPIDLQQEDTLEVPAPVASEPALAPMAPMPPAPMGPNVIAFTPNILESIYIELETPQVIVTIPEIEPVMHTGVAPITYCSDKDDNRKPVKGNGNVTTESRPVKAFKKLEINGIFDVIITQGDVEAVSVETDENLQEFILIEQDGDRLSLNTSSEVNFKKSTKMNVYVTVKSMTHLSSNGIGDVKTENQLNGKKLTVDISGVGDVDLNMNYGSLEFDYQGVGDVLLKGDVAKVDMDCMGVGNVKAYDLNTKEVKLDQSGVGDTEFFASDAVDIDFSGVGNVRYKGNPASKSIDKDGIGSVKAK
jgi:hypothetical protein